MDSENGANQNYHDSAFSRFLKLKILISDLDPNLGSWMDSEFSIYQNHHDSIFGWFLKVWSAIEIWVHKWILRPAQVRIIMIQYSVDFEILIHVRDLSSQMDSEPIASQNHHDSIFCQFLKFWYAIKKKGSKWILNLVQIKIIMIWHSADIWKFDMRSRFEFKNGFWAQPMA